MAKKKKQNLKQLNNLKLNNLKILLTHHLLAKQKAGLRRMNGLVQIES